VYCGGLFRFTNHESRRHGHEDSTARQTRRRRRGDYRRHEDGGAV